MNLLKTPVVFTANRLSDGDVVWLGRHGHWVDAIDRARIIFSEKDLELASAQAARANADNLVVEPYQIDVQADAGTVYPVKFRERIRAAGPTIRLDLGKQAAKTARAA